MRPDQTTADGARPRPFLVAHRAGNRISDLRAAELLGSALVEADVKLCRGQLEVRHLKSAGPLPVLWDRWRIAAGWRSRLTLPVLLAQTAPTTELMLDLKGRRGRLADRVLDAIAPHLGQRPFTVCARRWELLKPFAGAPVRRVHSIGTRGQLTQLLREFEGTRVDAVSIHERLLDAHSVAGLRAVADVVMTWPVNRVSRARELVQLGVDGLITDNAAELSRSGVIGLAPA